LPLGRALKKGATITKETLASQFKVMRDKKAIAKGKDIQFTPSPIHFRDYKIVKGRQVALPKGPDVYEYIERRTKRLTTGGELREIEFFKRRSKKRGFLL